MTRRLRSTVTTLVGLAAFVSAPVWFAAPAVAQTAPANNAPSSSPPPVPDQRPPAGYPSPPPAYGQPPPGYYPPPPYGWPGYPPRRPRRAKGLLIAGPIVLGATYAFTALVGLSISADDVDCSNCRTVGHRLLVPVLGPWLAIPAVDSSEGRTWTALLGFAQATGVILTVIGISRYSASVSEEGFASRGLHLAFLPRAGGGFGVLGARFW